MLCNDKAWMVSNNSIPSHHSARHLDCHMVPHGAGWHSTCDCLELGACGGCSLPDGFTQAWGAWSVWDWWPQQGRHFDMMAHGAENGYIKHRASSTTFCCRQVTRPLQIQREKTNSMSWWRKQNATQPREGCLTAPFADFLSKLM